MPSDAEGLLFINITAGICGVLGPVRGGSMDDECNRLITSTRRRSTILWHENLVLVRHLGGVAGLSGRVDV